MPSSTLCQPGTVGCGDCYNCKNSIFVAYINAQEALVRTILPARYFDNKPQTPFTIDDPFCGTCQTFVEGPDEGHRRTKLHKMNLVEYIDPTRVLVDEPEEIDKLFQKSVYGRFGNHFYCKEHDQKVFTREANFEHTILHHKRLYVDNTYTEDDFKKTDKGYVNDIEGYVCVYCDTGFQKFSDIRTHYRVLHAKVLSEDQHKELFKKYLIQWIGFSASEADEYESYSGCVCGMEFSDYQSYLYHNLKDCKNITPDVAAKLPVLPTSFR